MSEYDYLPGGEVYTDWGLVFYLLVTIGLLMIPILRAEHRRLKILYGLRFQLVVFLIIWSLGEIVEVAVAGEVGGMIRRAAHFAAMLGFAVFVTYSVGGLLRRLGAK